MAEGRRMARGSSKYDPERIETKWQKVWAEQKTFVVANPEPGSEPGGKGNDATYVLEMFPYPSGSAHMGHVKNYTMGDVIARFRRHQGQRVLHPMGYDAFGLNSENMAIKTGEPPAKFTEEAIATINRQLRRLGVSIDWTREVVTSRPEYYKWTQWLFLQFYKKGLAYKKEAPVNWCPSCQTVLANEQVVEGACERCDTVVEAKKLTQWFFRITDYAERLLKDFDKLESWPERVVTMQRNWIGKSTGADVVFTIAPLERALGTRDAARRAASARAKPPRPRSPSSPPGPTRCSGPPSSSWPRSTRWWTNWWPACPSEHEVKRYVAKAMATSHIERASIEKEKTGVFTGRYAVNPVTGGKIPIYRGRLRAHGLRHRRHHGRPRARRARLRLRQEVRAGRHRGHRRAPTSTRTARATCSSPTAATACWSTAGSSTGCRRPRASSRSPSGSRSRARPTSPSTTSCATGCCPASATGARRSPSSTATPAARCRSRTISCRCCCPTSPTTRPRASRRWRPPSTGSTPPARRAAGRPGARPTPWTPSSTPPGTTCATPRRGGATWPSTGRRWTTGCRWTSTSAGWSTPSST